MPAVAAYMLSALKRRLAAGGAPFPGADAGHWLVCEPGRWSGSGEFDLTLERGAELAAARAMLNTDALTFHLTERVPLKLGRSNLCDILINDATVSREHLMFAPDGHGWRVSVTASHGSTSVDGVDLKVSEGMRLESGSGIRVGDVRLRFLDARSMLERLSAE